MVDRTYEMEPIAVHAKKIVVTNLVLTSIVKPCELFLYDSLLSGKGHVPPLYQNHRQRTQRNGSASVSVSYFKTIHILASR